MISSSQYKFKAQVEKFNLPAAWYFVIVPEELMKKVKAKKPKTIGRGFFPVNVTLGSTTWRTSLLPMGNKTGDKRFFIALKASVRKNELVEAGEEITVRFDLFV